MRKQWGIWWTLPHTQAGDQRDSGPTRPALSLASVLHTSNQTHSVTFFLWSYTSLCASSPDLWRKHLSFLGNGDPAVPDWSMSHSLWHFPAFPASADCLYQHLLWRRQSTHSQDPLHQRWDFFKHHINHRDQEIISLILIIGGIDPWKELSVIQDRGEEDEEQVVFIEDTAHCADMMSKRVTDRSSLKTARAVKFIYCHYNMIIIQIKYTDTYGAC